MSRYEILHAPAVRLGLVLLAAALVLIGIPTMLVFFACMIEQKQFGDGFQKEHGALKGRSLRAVVLLVVVNLGLAVDWSHIRGHCGDIRRDSHPVCGQLCGHGCSVSRVRQTGAGGPVHRRNIGSPGGLWSPDRDILPVWHEKCPWSALGFYHAL
ncbi:MAG: hypothetical protein ACLR0U_31645 [Enterocloster clostridioformis]